MFPPFHIAGAQRYIAVVFAVLSYSYLTIILLLILSTNLLNALYTHFKYYIFQSHKITTALVRNKRNRACKRILYGLQKYIFVFDTDYFYLKQVHLKKALRSRTVIEIVTEVGIFFETDRRRLFHSADQERKPGGHTREFKGKRRRTRGERLCCF